MMVERRRVKKNAFVSYWIAAALLATTVIVGDGFSVPSTAFVHYRSTTLSRSTPCRRRGRSGSLGVLLEMATSSASPSPQDTADDRRAPTAKDAGSIRNVAFVGHSHAGKTALVEWMLYDEHVLGRAPVAGSSALDSDPTEVARHSSIFSHYCRVPHRGHLLEVADTPWGDFPADAAASLDGADAAVVCVSAADSVQSGTEHALEHCRSSGLPALLAVTKMDRPFVRSDHIVTDLRDRLSRDHGGASVVPLQVPVGEGDSFEGVRSLFDVDSHTGSVTKKIANADDDGESSGQVQEAWSVLEEAVAMTDDTLLAEYLENFELPADKVWQGLRSAVRRGKLYPLVYTAAERDLGVTELMDAVVVSLPSAVEMREEALRAGFEADGPHPFAKDHVEPGVEAGFAARVVHTMVDSFGSLSVLRIISNDRQAGRRSQSPSDGDEDDGSFGALPSEAVVLRTGEKVKLPAGSACYGLCGKERQPLADGVHFSPGDVIAVPKLPVTVQTNDILTIPAAVPTERAEITAEETTHVLTPLSRPAEDVPLMAAATVSLPNSSNSRAKGGRRGGGGGGDDKLLSSLKALSREDLAAQVEHDGSGNLILRGMSSDHLQILANRLRDRYGLEVELGRPPVAYRETLAKPLRKVEGRHKKQSGGSGQFGVCWIDVEPLPAGSGVEFESRIKGGVISKPFIASVEKGVREQLQAGGPLAGYPVTDVKVTLIDGKMHSVDSKDIAFQSAGRLAVKAALEKGQSRLLQPMEKVTFRIDKNLQGEINSIVSRGDGYVTSTNVAAPPQEQGVAHHHHMEVESILPTSAVADVSDWLRAASSGEAQFTATFSHYQAVPDHLVEDVLGRGAGAGEGSTSTTSNKLHP